MDGNTRSTTTKTLALVAMLVAAGVLLLRAQALFSAPVATQNIGSHQERTLTALLEPVIGHDHVRTSIQRDATGQTVWLIMVDGPALTDGATSSYTAQIETLITARGFDATSDTLRITQTPFARTGFESLSPRALAELGGLGLIVLLSFGIVLVSLPRPIPERPTETAAYPAANDRAPMMQAPAANAPSAKTAAALANAAPERTANIIRNWMRSDT
ncbi:hypothetical protein RYZ27_04400 [Hyphomonas sp. FCG-A18]|jgi:flagellar biosynthesis/type III secretory pathway M-ring protein FliF/YscJ|uniref:hypothetical protein n=1 Tax=Hyphomonas sp. FCG-A18 TaxID=3080019 RepID=UPI002B2F8FE0|nr:hypothetical protein RYZ27_04400 [Hyphomonas sp. FCG-A18]